MMKRTKENEEGEAFQDEEEERSQYRTDGSCTADPSYHVHKYRRTHQRALQRQMNGSGLQMAEAVA